MKYILYNRIIGPPSVEQALHEEYYVALNKIFASELGRNLFVDHLFNPSSEKGVKPTIWLGRTSFQNMKHVLDLFLYEAQDKSDLGQVLRVMPILELIALKNPDQGGVVTLKSRVRDHIVWKSEPVWRLRIISAIEDQKKS
jgi:hypothetical protein